MSRRTDNAGIERYSFKSLIGSADEAVDLTKEEYERAKRESGSETPTGAHIRRQRPPERGLLILYVLNSVEVRSSVEPGGKAVHIDQGDPFVAYCLSLPEDPTNTLVEYTVNNVYERDTVGSL
jgi:hypothetical protein